MNNIGAIAKLNICLFAQGAIIDALDERLSQSIAERRPRRDIQLPAQYRDDLPQALPPLPPLPPAPAGHPIVEAPLPSLPSRIRRAFKSPRNIFGLFRRYRCETPPSHDPEAHVDILELSDDSINPPATSERDLADVRDNLGPELPITDANSFQPFPNKNLFRVINWFWNGVVKSRKSLKELLEIIGDPEFKSEDIREMNLTKLDKSLAQNQFDELDEDSEWLDEDAGWRKTPITISVPFSRRTQHPGPKDYSVGNLYHRSLISVIREKLSNAQNSENFHYEPFQLHWQPTPDPEVHVRVHGEMYTSLEFLDAHHDLQNAPGEPGCTLLKVVVAMMFSSDATHLTSFGTAKLWPCYLYFGNESKYRCCKPTCNLCNHVAYFQSVRLYLPDLRLLI